MPCGEPKRYPNGDGYIRLRWKVGIEQYVETYEHRVFDGVVTDAEHVHHRNEVRDDNSPENLEPMTAEEHNAHHADRKSPKWYPFHSRDAAMKAAIAEDNRRERDKRTQLIRDLHKSGLSTIQIGRIVGLHPSGVWRYLHLGRNP